jgi:predicted XRE-type DNA-binding protein
MAEMELIPKELQDWLHINLVSADADILEDNDVVFSFMKVGSGIYDFDVEIPLEEHEETKFILSKVAAEITKMIQTIDLHQTQLEGQLKQATPGMSVAAASEYWVEQKHFRNYVLHAIQGNIGACEWIPEKVLTALKKKNILVHVCLCDGQFLLCQFLNAKNGECWSETVPAGTGGVELVESLAGCDMMPAAHDVLMNVAQELRKDDDAEW